MRFTIPISYSGQDFDEIQARALKITSADRLTGRPAPTYGYSEEAFVAAQKEWKHQRDNRRTI